MLRHFKMRKMSPKGVNKRLDGQQSEAKVQVSWIRKTLVFSLHCTFTTLTYKDLL